MKIFEGYYGYLKRKLISSGSEDVLAEELIFAMQITGLLALALTAFLLVPQRRAFLTPFFGLCGFVYPIFWLSSERKKRRAELEKGLPQFMDMLSLSVGAGLDLVSAISRIIKGSGPSVVTKEFGRFLNEIKLGKNRTEALLCLKKRIAHPSVDSLVSLLIQSEKLGTSISVILKTYSRKLRDDRFFNAEKEGYTASQKLLMPMVFCIMPAVFIVIFGPLLVMWSNGTFERLF